MINVRTWLICSLQNARLNAGAVKTLKVAPAVRSMGAVKATRIMPMTKPASVSNHKQIRYSVLLLLCSFAADFSMPFHFPKPSCRCLIKEVPKPRHNI